MRKERILVENKPIEKNPKFKTAFDGSTDHCLCYTVYSF